MPLWYAIRDVDAGRDKAAEWLIGELGGPRKLTATSPLCAAALIGRRSVRPGSFRTLNHAPMALCA